MLIVDYKTNRPPPDDAAQVAEAYLLQLAAYRLAVARIFPSCRVRAAILWTDGPRIMEIPRVPCSMPSSSGSGSSTRPALTPEGCLPTFRGSDSSPSASGHAPKETDPMRGGSDASSVSDADFDKEVLQSAEPVVVDFFAEWCGPCKAMAPALEQVAAEMKGKVKVAKLDVDAEPGQSRRSIASRPCRR